MTTIHVPILLDPIVESLVEALSRVDAPAWILDCTFGGGGHSAALW